MLNPFQTKESATEEAAQTDMRREPGDTPPAPETEAEAKARRMLLARLDAMTASADRNAHWRNSVCVFFFACLFLLFLLWPLLREQMAPGFFWIYLAFMYGAALSGFEMRHAFRAKAASSDLREFAGRSGVSAIPPLFHALEISRPVEQQKAILAALTVVLPRMRASDSRLLTPAARRRINSWFHTRHDWDIAGDWPYDLRLAALKTLEQAGDASAISAVERLSRRDLTGEEAERVRRAALDCLPLLRANCEENEAARTLLRASQAAEVCPDTLLRPASGAGQTDKTELLRGTDSPASAPPDRSA